MSAFSSPTSYVTTPEEADTALAAITQHSLAGVDSEFYGVDITVDSPVGRSICHVFSVAVPDGPLTPRGHNESSSWVFSGALLAYPPMKAWLEDPAYAKACHNQPAESHTFYNHGVTLGGGIDTLSQARFWYPQRAKREGFTLDSLGTGLCGVGKSESFDGLLGYDAVEQREIAAWKNRCECGTISCRKRSAGHVEKTPEEVMTLQNYKVRHIIPLTDLTPAHPLWARYLAYAAWDAVLALWIHQIMTREGRKTRPYPWLPS